MATNKPKVIALIPARGGSKSIKNKNIKLLNGKPLIFYTIKAAQKSKLIDRIIVSTDDKKIKKVHDKYDFHGINTNGKHKIANFIYLFLQHQCCKGFHI